MHIDELKQHFVRGLLHHNQGIRSDDLIDHVEQTAGPLEDTHRQSIHSWIDSLVSRGHMHRADDWINLTDEGRLEMFRALQKNQFTTPPF